MLNHITKDKIKKEGLHTIKAIVGMKDAAQIRLVAVISKSALAAKKAEGEFYLATTLFDKTGTISMPLWNSAEVLSEELTVGTVVFVTGTKGSYKDVPQISMKTIEIVDDIESTAFMPKYKTEVQILVKKLLGYACKIKEEKYKKMLEAILGIKIANDSYYEVTDKGKWEAFINCPAAVSHHGNKLHGLLMHTVGVTQAIDYMVTSYKTFDGVKVDPEDAIDADLLYFMGIVHDYCKTNEYTYDTAISRKENILVSHEVFLIGEITHQNILLGNLFTNEELSKIFLIEMLHHGDFGRYKLPEDEKNNQPLEAQLLHQADMIDSQIVGNIEKIKVPKDK